MLTSQLDKSGGEADVTLTPFVFGPDFLETPGMPIRWKERLRFEADITGGGLRLKCTVGLIKSTCSLTCSGTE